MCNETSDARELRIAIETACDQIHRLDPLRNPDAVAILTRQLEDLCSLQGLMLRRMAPVEVGVKVSGEIEFPTARRMQAINHRDDALRTILTRATQAFDDLSSIDLANREAHAALTRAREDLMSITLLCKQNLPVDAEFKTGAGR